MEKININDILSKKSQGAISYPNLLVFEKDDLNAVIKEIVEAVVNRCAESARIERGINTGFMGKPNSSYVDKQSILKVKEEIDY